MIRYVRQRQRSTCGPIAVLNALKWLGRPVTEKKDLPRLKKWCYWRRRQMIGGVKVGGTRNKGIENCLGRYKKVSFGYIYRPSKNTIDHILSKGNAFIMMYKKKDGGWHYIFCYGKTKKGNYAVVNFCYGKTTIRLKAKYFEGMLDSGEIFIIERKKK